MLTIAIPTYNRNERLARSLEILVPQLSESVKLIVIDNCSSTPVQDTLNPYLLSGIRVIRNKYNIGMAANILRCFESCDTEWLWVLGDDDPPREDAIEIIMRDIESHPHFGFLNFKSIISPNRINDIYATGPGEIITKTDSFGNLLFISVGIYNIKKLKLNLRVAYQLSYSVAPHIALLLASAQKDTQVCFLNKEILNLAIHDTPEEELWSWLTLSLVIPVLYEVPLAINNQEREAFAKLIKTHIKPPNRIYEMLTDLKYSGVPLQYKRYLLRQIFFRSLLSRSISKYILSYIWHDFKLFITSKILNETSSSEILKDERI